MLSVSQHLKFMEVLLSAVESFKMEFSPFALSNWVLAMEADIYCFKVCSTAF